MSSKRRSSAWKARNHKRALAWKRRMAGKLATLEKLREQDAGEEMEEYQAAEGLRSFEKEGTLEDQGGQDR